MKLPFFMLTLLMAPAFAAEVLLVGTAEAELGFVRATAFKPFHARFDIPFDEAKSLAAADLAARVIPTEQELKLGVVTALFGAPVFALLAWRAARSWRS
jgi:hypothetical protein